ncbi:hypothetical protein [Halogranum amylolyticum]|uniref:hypothetical protein n=1 Tax=Halogranum amylolyticum TaxID=660520 RepID=UPI0011147DB8|nr:hypothetical protein [Halogranum amylolyticum]
MLVIKCGDRVGNAAESVLSCRSVGCSGHDTDSRRERRATELRNDIVCGSGIVFRLEHSGIEISLNRTLSAGFCDVRDVATSEPAKEPSTRPRLGDRHEHNLEDHRLVVTADESREDSPVWVVIKWRQGVEVFDRVDRVVSEFEVAASDVLSWGDVRKPSPGNLLCVAVGIVCVDEGNRILWVGGTEVELELAVREPNLSSVDRCVSSMK